MYVGGRVELVTYRAGALVTGRRELPQRGNIYVEKVLGRISRAFMYEI